MKIKVKFLAHQVLLGVISLNNIPEKYKEAVENYILNKYQEINKDKN